MNDEYNPNPSFEDLIAQEEEAFAPESVSLKSGIGGNQAVEAPKTVGQNPHAVRYIFNPFEIIDLSNKPASCGMTFLNNVIFNKVKSIPIAVGKPFDETGAGANATNVTDQTGTLNQQHNPENYTSYSRTAYMIARELEEHYGEKGVINVAKILGEEDGTAADLNTLLFGDEIDCVYDPNNPEHPCPVLPNLLEILEANVKENSRNLDAESRSIVIAVATQVRASINTAMRNARMRVDEAQKRILDEKNPNRSLSHAEQRCYLALGEEIPNVMPFVTRKASQGMNAGQGIDYEALGRGVVAAQMAAGTAIAPVPVVPEVKKAETFAVPKSDLETATCTAVKANNELCKNKAVDGVHCKAHGGVSG